MKRIKIDNPCSENWDKMTPEGKNKFCASCQKTVHDFSKSSHEEIIRFFKQPREEKVCGFVMKDQIVEVNQKLNQRSSNSVSKLVKPGIVAASILLASCGITPISNFHSPNVPKFTIVESGIHSDLSETILILGKVKDISGEEIPTANVFVRDKKIGASTDFNGFFRLEIPKHLIDEDQVKLEISFIGYDPVIIYLDDVKNAQVEIFLKESEPSYEYIGFIDPSFE